MLGFQPGKWEDTMYSSINNNLVTDLFMPPVEYPNRTKSIYNTLLPNLAQVMSAGYSTTFRSGTLIILLYCI